MVKYFLFNQSAFCSLGEGGGVFMDTRLSTTEFGRSGRTVTIVGLGGEGVLRTYDRHREAQSVIEEAVNEGIRYFDSAAAYAGSQEYYGRIWSAHPEHRAGAFQASKSAQRTRDGALAELEITLRTMRIPHLDLWQIHDVRSAGEVRQIAGRGGALEAFLEAKEQGLVKHIGVTGHHDPSIIEQAMLQWPVDSIMIPINPVEGALGGFVDLIARAHEEGIAVIGMKVLGASHYLYPEQGISAEVLIRYALSQHVTVAIVGCSTPEEVRTLASVARNFVSLRLEEQKSIVDRFAPYARKLAYYRGVI